ncbi:hypothetical protein ABFS82_09G104800 [Erythranthe guttata]|uniref:putative Peroxidase 48 n=1 Tax=Erythranthe guttata TaxID=4155 RepID=UPI00064DC3D8|nr:PREDICTED: putative Peroxidase 48 [Erythranthe guttata]|eukprot:XP_012856370.1 PREDICTED: putative Peroxidase 48 [Erythranthe guttata]
MDFTRKLSFVVFILCVLISLKKKQADINRRGCVASDSPPPLQAPPSHRKLQQNDGGENVLPEGIRYDYYNESCPSAEQIIRSTVQELYEFRPDVAPALLRLAFHDCFVKGCDASILLDPTNSTASEKEAFPNQSLRGFDVIDIIKSEVEEACPGVVSCADIVVLAARESVLVAGGPFYPLLTGRKDNKEGSLDEANRLPSPQDHLYETLHKFQPKGFTERETITLLGAHSVGTIHCSFFNERLFNFKGSNAPDPSIDAEFLGVLRSKCNSSHSRSASQSASAYYSPYYSSSPSLSPSPSPTENSSSQNPGMKMDYEGPRKDFGTLYYRSLLQRKGLLFVDQQLTSMAEAQVWVQAYASDLSLFKRDFGLAMMKLSNLHLLNASVGEVRLNCRKVN